MTAEIQNFTDLTCTNFMIKIKILTKKLKLAENLSFYANREQYDNIKELFMKNGFQMQTTTNASNIYLCFITKIK